MSQRYAWLLGIGLCCWLTSAVWSAPQPKKAPPKKRATASDKTPATPEKNPSPPETKPPERPSFPPRPLSNPEKILEKMVEEMGGREALQSVQSTYGEGSLTIVTRVGEQQGKLYFYLLKPAFQRVDQIFGTQTFSLATYPDSGWIKQNGAILRLPRSMIEMSKEEAARHDLELRYREEGISVIQRGESEVGGHPCHVLLLEDKQKRQTTYTIDKKTHLLRKRTYLGLHPLGQGEISISTVMDDYRWQTLPNKKKIRFPFTMSSFLGGNKTSTIRFKKLLFNSSKVNKKTFRPPSPTD